MLLKLIVWLLLKKDRSFIGAVKVRGKLYTVVIESYDDLFTTKILNTTEEDMRLLASGELPKSFLSHS